MTSPLSKTKGRSKYRAVATIIDGIHFASKAEAARDAELVLLDRADIIRCLERQPRYDIHVADKKICTYVGDWRYWERVERHGQAEWIEVVEDKKGMKTPVFRLKWKMVKALYPHIEWRIT